MADQHDPLDPRTGALDLRTLEQVQHLLATTTFASIDDVARRGGEPLVAAEARPRPMDAGSIHLDSAGAAPLPRRQIR